MILKCVGLSLDRKSAPAQIMALQEPLCDTRTGFKNNLGRPAKTDLEKRLDFVDGIERKRSTMLLFVGAMSGFFGFGFAGFLGLWGIFNGHLQNNYVGEPLQSGINYYPQTVSEMVYDPASPAGKCFFAFCMIGAICIMISNYPFHLRNAYVGDDDVYFGVSVLSYRAMMPPIGMMLVACITTTPAAKADFRDKVCVMIHTFGAVIMIGGHALFELHNLRSPKAHTRKRERTVRYICLISCVVAMLGFEICGGLAGFLPKKGVCCADVWRAPNITDIRAAYHAGHPGIAIQDALGYEGNKGELVNSASGVILVIKILEYWCEVFAGLFMIAGHIAIWYYSPERSLDLLESIPDHDEDVKVDDD